jgi:hypothetical protein
VKGGSRPQGGPAPFSQALDEAQDHGRARETIRLFGQQELDEISLITADGRVFAGDEPLPPFQEPGTALLRARSNGHNELDEDGRAQDCVTEGVTSELLAEIAADPAGYYVNVHNATFPAGAVRGQLEQNPQGRYSQPR